MSGRSHYTHGCTETYNPSKSKILRKIRESELSRLEKLRRKQDHMAIKPACLESSKLLEATANKKRPRVTAV
jgi:hypothetical protein